MEMVLYYVMPQEEFSNAPLTAAVVEILVSSVILPVVSLISDPDYINSLIVWAVSVLCVTFLHLSSNVGYSDTTVFMFRFITADVFGIPKF